MAETPTREELLAARIAYLSAWLERAQAEHAKMTVLLAEAESGHRQAMQEADRLAFKAHALELNIAKRGCCKVEHDA